MWSMVISVFLVIFGPVNYYIGRRGWQAIGRHVPHLNKWVYWAVFWLVAGTFPAAEFGEDALPAGLMIFLTYAGGFWIVAMVYFFLAILLIDIVRLADRLFKFIPVKVKASSRLQGWLGLTVLVVVLSLAAYGIWNARHPVITGYDLTVHKKANGIKQMHIVMVSDIHIGSIVRPDRLNPLVAAVNRLQPDLILFTGDIVERSLDTAEAQDLINVLSRLRARYGMYAVAGNHDRPRGQGRNLADYLEEAHIKVLQDAYEKVGGSLYLVGRNNGGMHREGAAEAAEAAEAAGQALGGNPGGRYAGNRRLELAELLSGVDTSLPVILMDHQPIDVENAQRNKVDIQLSGHTHNGKVFPINLITGRLFDTDWGLLTRESYNLIVSCGYGTWGPPLRIGNHPEIVDINVRFE